jgi:hypothetical protein
LPCLVWLVSCSAYSSILKMVAICSSEILGCLWTTWHYNQKTIFFVCVDLQTIFHTCYMGMFMTKFHMPSPSYCHPTKRKREFLGSFTLTFYERIISTDIPYSLKIYYIISGLLNFVALPPRVMYLPCCYHWLQGIEKVWLINHWKNIWGFLRHFQADSCSSLISKIPASCPALALLPDS